MCVYRIIIITVVVVVVVIVSQWNFILTHNYSLSQEHEAHEAHEEEEAEVK